MCLNCESNILNDALITLDPIFAEHGEYNILFMLNDYYVTKYADAIATPPKYSDPRQQAIWELFQNEDISQWESNTSHMPWCSSMLGQPYNTPECDCSSSNRRKAESE
jgi:hypothetical protein